MLKPSDSRGELLNLIKKRGQLTLNQASEETGLSRTTLREHFINLEYDGYLQRSSKREGRGRPEMVFELTEKGHRHFPSLEGPILQSFLRYLKQNDQEKMISEFFTKFWDKRLREAEMQFSEMRTSTLEEKLDVLKHILDEQGFMPEIQLSEDGRIIISECNCPLRDAIKETRLPCKLEAEFMQKLLKVALERVSYIPDGNRSCTYELQVATAGS